MRAFLMLTMSAALVSPASAADGGTASHPSATVETGLSPAVALAMALGVRSVSGPVEQAKSRRAAAMAAKSNSLHLTRQAMLLPSDRDVSTPFALPFSGDHKAP